MSPVPSSSSSPRPGSPRPAPANPYDTSEYGSSSPYEQLSYAEKLQLMELTAASCAGVSVVADGTWRYGGGGGPAAAATATTGRQPAHVPHAHVPSAVGNLGHLRHVLGCPWSPRAPSLAAWAGDREALTWLLSEGCPHHGEQEGGGVPRGPGAVAWGSGVGSGGGAAVLQRVPGGLMAAAACRRDAGLLDWVACEVLGVQGVSGEEAAGSGGGGEGLQSARRERLRAALSAEVFTAAVEAVAAAAAAGAASSADGDTTIPAAAATAPDVDMEPVLTAASTPTHTSTPRLRADPSAVSGPAVVTDLAPTAAPPSADPPAPRQPAMGPLTPAPSAPAWPPLPPLTAADHSVASPSTPGSIVPALPHLPSLSALRHASSSARGARESPRHPHRHHYHLQRPRHGHSTPRSSSCSCPGEAPPALPLPQPGTPSHTVQLPGTPTATPTAWQAAALPLSQPGTPPYSAQQPCTPTTHHFGPQQQQQQQLTHGPSSCQRQSRDQHPHAFLRWLLDQGCPVDFGAAAVAAAAQGSRPTLEWLKQHADRPTSNGCGADVNGMSAGGAGAAVAARTAEPVRFGHEVLVAAARSAGGLRLMRWLLDEAGCEAGDDPTAVLRAAVQGPPAATRGERGRCDSDGEQKRDEQDDQEDGGRVELVAWLCDRMGLYGRLGDAAGAGVLEAAMEVLAAESPVWPHSPLPDTQGATARGVPSHSASAARGHGQGRGQGHGQAGTGVVRWLLLHGGCRPSPAAMQRAAAAGRADLLDLMLRNQHGHQHLYGNVGGGGGGGAGHVAGWAAAAAATPLVRQELLAAACGSGSAETVAWVLQAAGRPVALPPGLVSNVAVQQQVPVAFAGVEAVEGSVQMGQECFEAAAGGGHLHVLQYLAAVWWAEHAGKGEAGSGGCGGDGASAGGGSDRTWLQHPGAPWRASSVLASAASSAAAGAGDVVRWLVEVAGAEAADPWVMCGAAYCGDLARMQYLYGSAGARPTAEAFLVCAWAGRVRHMEWLVRQAGCPMQEEAWIWPGHRRDVDTLDALERLGCPRGTGALRGVAGLGTDVAVLRWLYDRYALPLDEQLADAVPGAEQREEVAAWVREVRAGGGVGGRAGGRAWGPAGGLVRLAAAAFRRPW